MHDETTPDRPAVPDRPASTNWQTPSASPASDEPVAGLPTARPVGPPPPWAYPPRRSILRRVVVGILGMIFVCSILMNLYLLVLLGARLAGGFDKTVIRRGQEDQQIAVYEVSGTIDGAAAQRFSRFFREIQADTNIRAVVLRVNSPGGGVTSADQIHHQVSMLKEQGKAVVVSMGALAASGGYYISAGADEILAEPTTITGSIGAIMYWPVIKGTLEKLGVEMVVLKSHGATAWKDEGSPFLPPQTRHREHLQEILNDIQKKFEDVVVAGRGQRLQLRESQYGGPADPSGAQSVVWKEVEPLNGKIYLAEEALELGLVDRIGYESAALMRAADLAGLDDARIVRYRTRRGLLDEMLQGRSNGLGLNVESLDELQTPRILLMWKAE